MKPASVVWVVLALAVYAAANDEGKKPPAVFFHETFGDGEGWLGRWVNSSFSDSVGNLNISKGWKYLDELEDLGLKTTEDYRHYAVSARFDPFSNKDRDLVFQFTVKNEHILRCGGTYFKLLGCNFKQAEFGPNTDYLVMFGPDICGPENRKLHVILSKRGENHPLTKHLKLVYFNFFL
jgi:calreticulin